MSATNELPAIEWHFHDVIRARAIEFQCRIPEVLPSLDEQLIGRKEPEWFAVPGMYGGFAYTLHRVDGQLVLRCRSWCRVVGGSGMEHAITADGATLVESGFAH